MDKLVNKLLFVLPIVFIMGMVGVVSVKAATQYNWGTSTGANWTTPDDTTTTKNQFLQIGNSATSVVAVSTPTINFTTLASMKASTPTSRGNVLIILDALSTTLCVSTNTTGSPNGGSLNWIAAVSSSVTNAKTPCF